jgi:hypothetical protein
VDQNFESETQFLTMTECDPNLGFDNKNVLQSRLSIYLASVSDTNNKYVPGICEPFKEPDRFNN